MKRNLLLSLALAGMAFTSAHADTFQPNYTGVPHHKMYAYFQNNGEMSSYGFASLWTNYYHAKTEYDDFGVELLYPYDVYVGDNSRISGVLSIYGGAAIDGVYYAPQYEYSAAGGVVPAPFISHNMYTGERIELGTWAESGDTKKVQDMTYDEKNKKMYALAFSLGHSTIDEVDLKTGKLTTVCELPTTMGTIAANKKGEIFCIGAADGILYKIFLSSGTAMPVYKTGMKGMTAGQTMEFDKTNGDLYWTSSTTAFKDNEAYPEDSYNRSYMMRFQFDENGNVTSMDNIDEIGEQSCVRAMYIPYADGGANAPAAPTDVTGVPDQSGARKVTLSWTNPTTTFDGDNLTAISNVTITRDDEVIKTFDEAQVGAKMTFVDETAEKDKQYKYAIYASNDAGKGGKGLLYQYVGLDVPAAPTNLFIKVGDGAQTTTISWDPVTKGAHGNRLDAKSVKYDVVRMPGNSKIGTDLETTSVEDKNIRRLGNYYYIVTAKNEVGSNSANTTSWVFGKAYQVNADQNYDETFEDASKFSAQWVGIDNNEDAYSWMINSTAASNLIGDGYDYGVVYLINPTFTPSNVSSTDEWLLAPPIKISDDDDYVVDINARSFTAEKLAITCGSRNLTQDQKVLANLDVNAGYDKNGYPAFKVYTIDLPKGAGYKCLGMHLTTPVSDTRNQLIQINEFNVRHKKAGEVTGIKDINNETSKVAGYYSLDGRKLSAPAKGINIVKMTNGETKKVLVK